MTDPNDDIDNDVVARDVDFRDLRRRLGNLTARDLIRAAAALGWTEKRGRGKGSHAVLQKGGRSITVPMHQNKQTYRSILDELERSS